MYFLLFTLLAWLLPVKCLYAGDSCIADDEPGTCTRLTECTPLITEIKKAGRPLPLDIRVKLKERSCGFEWNEPVVCCIHSSDIPSTTLLDIVDNSSTIMKSEDVIHETDDNKPPTIEKPDTVSRVGDVPDIQSHPNMHLLPTETCGVSDDSFRILEGNRTGLFEMPWMVLLAYETHRGRRLSCGGTLINDRYVLTAAHCVSNLSKSMKFTEVVLGEWDIRKDPDCERIADELFCAPSTRNVIVETVIAHTGYSPQTLVDDIALLRLSESVDFDSARVKPLCLPITTKLQNEDLVGLPATVAGWGATETGMQSPVLLSVELTVVSNKECQDAYHGTPFIQDGHLCAGGIGNKDTCAGDSGGPLMYYGNTGAKGIRFVQRGIVSFGSKPCGNGPPGVFTRIGYYMNWILDNIHK